MLREPPLEAHIPSRSELMQLFIVVSVSEAVHYCALSAWQGMQQAERRQDQETVILKTLYR